MQNCSGGVNQACIKANADNKEEWKCFFAQYTEPHISSHFFGLNSQYDTWQLGNILQLPCTPPKCTSDMMKAFENFGKVSRPLSVTANLLVVLLLQFFHTISSLADMDRILIFYSGFTEIKLCV